MAATSAPDADWLSHHDEMCHAKPLRASADAGCTERPPRRCDRSVRVIRVGAGAVVREPDGDSASCGRDTSAVVNGGTAEAGAN